MDSRRQLISYLPPFMQEYIEIQEIMRADQFEVDTLWDAIERAFADQFIWDATEYGVHRWEVMLKIQPKDTDTLDERKFRILARLNSELPYTMTKLKEVLTNLCGADGFTIDLIPNLYHIEIKLAVGKHSNFEEVKRVLNKMIPANLTPYISLMYNVHRTFRPYRHSELAAYNHYQLRNEVINHA